MVSSTELTQTASLEVTTESLKLLSVNEAREIQQARHNTVNSPTEPENKDVIIIESEDNNPDVHSQADCRHISEELVSPYFYPQNSSKQYDELALLSKRKARAILRVGNDTLNRLINEGKIKIIVLNGKEKIPFVSLQEYVYNMCSKQETATGRYEIIGEEEAEAIANKILEEINKGEI